MGWYQHRVHGRVRTDEKAFSSASKIKKATTNSDDDTTKNEEVSFDPWDILNHVCNNWFYLVSFVALFTSYGQPSSTKQRTNARHIKAVISISGEKEDGTRGSKKSLMSFIVHSFKNRLSIGVRNIASISIFFTGLFHTVVTASGSKLEPLLNTSKGMNKKPLEVDINAEDLLADLGEDHKSARNGPTSNSPKKSATAQKNKKNNYIKRGNNICENIKKNKVESYTQKVSSQTEPRFEVLSDDYTDDVDDDGEWITMDHHKSRSPNNNRVHSVNNGLNGNMVFQSNRKISKDAPPVKEEDKNLLRSNNIAPCTLSTPSVLSDDLTTVSNEKASYESVAAKNQKHDKYKDCEDSDAISSDGMGSTSDESEDTHIHDSTPRARNLNIETIVKSTSIATSPARVSHNLGMKKTTECVSGVVRDHDSLGTHNKTEKLRKLLSISTTTPSSAIVSATKYPVISEPIRQSNPPTVDGSCNAPVSPASMTPMQIVVLPQPNGTGILMMMGIDGLCYPIPSGVFPDQSQYSEYSVASQRIEVVNRIRIQIEFYFSPQNLVRDTYLKSLMDENGYVRIEQIMPFNRIIQLMADPYLVLEAVQTSRELDIDEPWAVKAAKGDVMATRAINPSTVLTTRIRCLREPLKWVPPKTS